MNDHDYTGPARPFEFAAIRALRDEARAAGNTDLADVCNRALAGDMDAYDTCADILDDTAHR